jgi:2-dehydro-3-deoxyphosphooctonate aldolase (KDO 8-P synthase)
MAPWDMKYAVAKIRDSGNDQIVLTERGTSFGYNNLVVDMRSLTIMRNIGFPVIFDATHSVQLPGGGDGCSSGQREFVSTLSKAAMAAGVDGIFMEVHPNPDKALCDGPNSLSLDSAASLLKVLSKIRYATE